MDISLEEARLLLTKWKNDSAFIVLYAELPRAKLVLTGMIFEIDLNEIRFVCGTGSHVAIDIESVAFQYGDPREVPEVQSPGNGPTYHSFLYLATSDQQVTYAMFEPTEDHMRKFSN